MVAVGLLLGWLGVGQAMADTVAATSDSSRLWACLLYTSDAADERSSVDLGGRRIIKKKKLTAVSGSDG